MKISQSTSKILLREFKEAYYKNLNSALKSGALSGNEEPMLVAKAVLVITARNLRMISTDGKILVEELEHHIG